MLNPRLEALSDYAFRRLALLLEGIGPAPDRAPIDLFDATVISGDVGLHTPQPEIYRLACERLGVEPGEAVFVDDLRENVAGAEAVGMAAVLHRHSAATIAELEALLGLPLT